MDEGLLASAVYDGDLRVAVLKFYDPKNSRFWLWRDNTGHRPYCYTKLSTEELAEIRSRKDVVEIREEEKLDLLTDQKVKVRKIVTTDPLAIGGGNDSIRDRITAWEADIKYYENYAYDRGLKMGTFYRVSSGKVIPVSKEVPENVRRSLEAVSKKNPPEFVPFLNEWAELLGQPLTDFRRVAVDIEVANEEGRLPDQEEAKLPVIAVSFCGENERTVYALRRGKDADPSGLPYSLVLFDDEAEMLRATFDKMMDYPVVVTFNGDNFDLRYLKHRAENLNVGEDENPIELQRVESSVKHGVHIDLYNFFKNRSIQVYAFSNKYTEHTLNGIAEALIGRSKVEFEGEVGELPILDLAKYCLNDSQLTYDLTTMKGSVVMKLLLVIARIAKMPMNDVGRLGVSNWIRSMLFYEHRRLNALIPRSEELTEKGGASSRAIIKGKKYKGGFVIEPKPGVFFDVSVLDFASLYPSLIKVHNLSYETVNCPHEECKSTTVPDTTHWVCRKRKGITSLVVGSLRDLRVGHYKPLTRDPSLSGAEKDLYAVVTQGLKVILNAAYGVMGFETFAFYCLPVAEATAAFGRNAITRTIAKCNELGISVLYGDTDSLFLQNITKDQISMVTRWAEVELGVELDLDKAYRYVAFSSRKKNYFGVLPDGTVDIRGLTGKKSVDGRTPMIARIDNRVRLTTVSGVYGAFKRGLLVEVITVVEGLNTAWTRISDAMKHSVDEVYRVSTSKGRDLILSGDHSVYLIDTFGQLHAKETRLLKPGDVVVGAQYVPPRVPSTFLWTPDHIAAPVRVGGGLVHSGKPHATVGVAIPAKVPLTPDLGFLLGIYVAEGSTSERRGSRNNSITQSRVVNPEVCAEIERAWQTVFLRPVNSFDREGAIRNYYLPKLHAEFFGNLCGATSREKHVPDVAFDADDAFVTSFLRAIFSGDGYGDGRRVNLASKSEALLVGVTYLLARLDIDCRIRKLRVQRATYHQLSIIGTSSRKRFYRLVGFLQPRFNRRVSTGHRNKELMPITTQGLMSIKASMALRRGVRSFRGVEMHDRRRYNLSMLNRYNAVIGSLLQIAEPDERVALAAISRMLNVRDVSYDEVVSVRKLRGSRTMFDFSVPVFERFVAGNLPTLLHNSQTPEFLKQTFYKTLEILSGVKSSDDFERARSDTRKLLTEMINKLRRKQVPVGELAFTVMMGKPTSKYSGATPQHVRAAQALEAKGKEVKAGEIIAYVKTKSPPYVKPAEHARPDDIDADKYIEYAHSMFDQLLDALDFSFDEMMGATTLDAFWS